MVGRRLSQLVIDVTGLYIISSLLPFVQSYHNGLKTLLTTRIALKCLFVAVFLGYNQYWPGGFIIFVVLCPGAPEGSPAVVLVLKRLRRLGHSLKSHPQSCTLSVNYTIQ